jgi:hypothetical protein
MNKILLILALLLIVGFLFCFVGKTEISSDLQYGTMFSQKQSKSLGLNWKENYISILDDLGFKNIKILTYWDLIERDSNIYSFTNLDWQIEEAIKRDVNVLLQIGNCEFPKWLEGNFKEESLSYLNTVILRYEDNPNVIMWDLGFKECVEKDLFISQIDFITKKSKKPLLGYDVDKYMIYRNTLNPVFYTRKALISGKDTIIETRGEPRGDIEAMTRDEWNKSMNLSLLKKNVNYVANTGIDMIYISGSEWWYLLKQRYGDAGIWDYVNELIN